MGWRNDKDGGVGNLRKIAQAVDDVRRDKVLQRIVVKLDCPDFRRAVIGRIGECITVTLEPK